MNATQQKAPGGNGGSSQNRPAKNNPSRPPAQRRKPPFALSVIAHLKARPSPFTSVKVFAGREAWERAAQQSHCSLALPIGAKPEAYDWGSVARHCSSGSFIVFDVGSDLETLKNLARTLIRQGAAHVWVSSKAHGYSAFKAQGGRYA